MTTVPSESYTFKVGQRTVGWHVYGKPSDEPLLFIHGWGMVVEGYGKTLMRLAAQGWQIHAMDLPGFGKTDALPARWSDLQGYVEFVSATVGASPLKGVTGPVVGHSFGAGIAAKAAVLDYLSFSDMMLVTPIGGGCGPDGWALLAKALLFELNQHIAISVSASAGSAVRHPLALARSAFAAKTADMYHDLAVLRERGVPVHIVFADQDKITPPRNLRWAPSTTTTMVQGNHGWMLNCPDEFVASARKAFNQDACRCGTLVCYGLETL
jgi:pimeloyl-ACP methyl ester carboxylesterase